MPSRDDVAKRAGVSGATVSYVLNDNPKVSISDSTRRAVLRAARELGYRPSHAARSLARGSFRQIGVLGPAGDTLFSPYHSSILHGAWRVASAKGYRLVIDTVGPDGTISFTEERFVDALVALGVPPGLLPSTSQRQLKSGDLPVILVGGGSWAEDFHTIDVDNAMIGRKAAEYLAERGHSKCLLFGCSEESPVASARRRGFVEGLAEQGIRLPKRNIVDTDRAEAIEAYEAAVALLRRRRDFTAVFCHNDPTAVGFMRAAWEQDLKIPQDISVVGVDASAMNQFSNIRLTSFRQPLEAMGEEAMRLAMDPPAELVHRLFPIDFVEGESVRTVGRKTSRRSSRRV